MKTVKISVTGKMPDEWRNEIMIPVLKRGTKRIRKIILKPCYKKRLEQKSRKVF
jgi:hypothetical protein